MQYFKNLSIYTKFILWFLLISLIPLAIAITISYNSSQKALEKEIRGSLIAIADSKLNQIEAYLRRQKKDATTLAYMPEITDALDKFDAAFRKGKDSPEYSAAVQEFKPMFAYYQRLFDYDDILFINSYGSIIFSAQGLTYDKPLYDIAMDKKIALDKNFELADSFMRAQTSRETDVSNFEYLAQANRGAFFITTPFFKDENLTGAVTIQIDNTGVYELVQDFTGLGETGETILVTKKGEELVFITPSRFDPQAAFKRKIKIDAPENLDVQKVIQGQKGSGVFVDYRGQKVLAVWRYLSAFKIGMVVKMDMQEVFASAQRLRNTLFLVSVILLIIIVILALMIAHSVYAPIKELTKVSGIIAFGDLSVRARVEAGDEIGELAKTFNKMTSSLIEAKANVEQKKAEVEEQKSLLEQANKELDSFVYTVSHDLRAPLRGIDGFATFLQQDCAPKLDNQGNDYLNRIRCAAMRMKELIDDLLTLSRISRIKNPYEDVDMHKLVNSVINRIEFDIKEHKVELKIAKNLPIVRCDRIKMEEVFFNLVNNAIKFSSKGKDAHPRVEIGYNHKDGAHEFYVKDNGIGIDKKYHQEIFGIFKRLHRYEEYEGTGTGLSIVKKIIDDHRGSIWIDSELGKGAAFCFSIPKVQEEVKAEDS